MPSDAQLADAVLRHVQGLGYPESGDIADSELPATALPSLIARLDEAANEAKVSSFVLEEGSV